MTKKIILGLTLIGMAVGIAQAAGFRCSSCNGTGFNGNVNCFACKGTGRNSNY